jgi:hypothetical protein
MKCSPDIVSIAATSDLKLSPADDHIPGIIAV